MSADDTRPARLIGRDEQLREIGQAFDSISVRGQALTIIGDPGVGKTALLGAAAADARGRGLTVLSVRGTEAKAHLRFAALHELLGPILDRAGELPPKHREALAGAFGLERAGAAPERFFIALAALDYRGLEGIDAAASAGLLYVSGGSFRFRHPLVRSAVAQMASPARRAEVHQAFARALAADPDRATWHRALAASRPDEELAAALDAGTDRAAAHGAPGLAEQWLERAAELSPDARRRGHRLLRAAELAFELGRV